MDGFQQFAAVVIVLAALLAAVWLLRSKSRLRSLPFQRRRTAALESLDRLTLTAQHSLHLVRVGKRVIVVGVCPSSMTVIREIESDVDLLPGGAQ